MLSFVLTSELLVVSLDESSRLKLRVLSSNDVGVITLKGHEGTNWNLKSVEVCFISNQFYELCIFQLHLLLFQGCDYGTSIF